MASRQIDRSALSRVLVVGNGKGGVGKTSLSANIAGINAAAGRRVLLVDLDPQGNLGQDLGYSWRDEGDDGEGLQANVMMSQPLTPTLTDVRPNLDVVCGGESVEDLALYLSLPKQQEKGAVTRLASSLSQIADDYDLVIIDTPPTNAVLQELALAAARWLLITTAADASSILGLSKIAQRVASVRDVNPALEILGVALFGVDTRAAAVKRTAAEQITEVLEDVAPLFRSTIRHSIAVATDARNNGRLVHEIAEQAEQSEPWYAALKEGRTPKRIPGSAGAVTDDYLKLTDEILTRIAQAEAEEEE